MDALGFWQFISIFGSIQFWVVITAISIVVFILSKRSIKKSIDWFVFGLLPAVAISWVIAEGLKLLFKIPRPCAGLDFCPITYSFPSGHAAVIFAAMTVAIFYSKSRKMVLSFLILVLLVSLSRVFLGMHRIEDATVGGLIGFIVGFLVYKNYKEILHRFKLRL